MSAPATHQGFSKSKVPWPDFVITFLAGIFAIYLVWPQVFPNEAHANELNLPNLDKRAAMLAQISDPVQREQYCIGLAAYGRALDRAIPTNARIFFSGVVGKTNASHIAYYYFLRNYLFPRDLEISLEKPAVLTAEGYFDGVDCGSEEILKTNGFDLLLKFGGDGGIQIQPLTEKGVPKQ